MKKFLILTPLLTIFLQGCGNGAQLAPSCIPNYEENGLGLLVSKHETHLTTFQFEVCYLNPKLQNTVTIYGFDTESFDDLNVTAWWRYKNINLEKGARFTVEFNGDDNYFFLFEDSATGELQKNTKLVHGLLYND